MSTPQHANPHSQPYQQRPPAPWDQPSGPQPGPAPAGMHGGGPATWTPQPQQPKRGAGSTVAGIVLILLLAVGSMAACGAILEAGGDAGASETTATTPEAGDAAAPGEAAADTAAPPAAPTSFRKVTAREWAKIARNPDAHVGEAVIVYGYVTQADAATGQDVARASVDGERHRGEYGYLEYESNVVMGAQGLPAFSELVTDDIFQAHVEIKGSFEYDTQLGGKTTATLLRVHKIKVIGTADA